MLDILAILIAAAGSIATAYVIQRAILQLLFWWMGAANHTAIPVDGHAVE